MLLALYGSNHYSGELFVKMQASHTSPLSLLYVSRNRIRELVGRLEISERDCLP